jgi:hypothetical protein
LSEIPDAISSLTETIEHGVNSAFMKLYREKRDITVADIRRQMNEFASQSLANANLQITSSLGGFTLQDFLMGPDPPRVKVEVVQREVVADFERKCRELHEAILTDIPDAIASLTETIEHGINSAFTPPYRKKRDDTIADVRRELRSAADSTLAEIAEMSSTAWRDMSPEDFEKSEALKEADRYQATATGELERRIRALAGFTADGAFKPYFDEADQALKESVKARVVRGWQRHKMTIIVARSSIYMAHAAGWSILPLLDWAWVGPIWRSMMTDIATVGQVQLSPTLISECVDAYKTYARSRGSLIKFVPVWGTISWSVGVAINGEYQTKEFGMACIDTIMEYPVNTHPNGDDFKAKLEVHVRAGRLQLRDFL